MNGIQKREANWIALTPLLIFISIMIGTGIILSINGVQKPFHQLPASVALFIGIIVAFIVIKAPVGKKSKLIYSWMYK